MKVLLIIVAIIVAVLLTIRMVVRRAVQRLLDSPQFKDILARQRQRQDSDDSVLEQAPWFGTTGLPAHLERALPPYLRREFGESLLDAGALQAADLSYLGSFKEGASTLHYWSIPRGSAQACYAYIEIDGAGQSITGWGNRQPPALLPDQREP